MKRKVFLITQVLTLVSCAGTKAGQEFPVAKDTVAPGSEIKWIGEPTKLEGDANIQVGKPFPSTKLTDNKMQAGEMDLKGKVSIISVVPSIDTPVCEVQSHSLGETKDLKKDVQRITVSVDLPYAQRRFSEEAKLTNIKFYSDYRYGSFAKQTGLGVQRNGLLARAVIVTDANGVVRYIQVVPEVTQMPDMQKAFAVANDLSKDKL